MKSPFTPLWWFKILWRPNNQLKHLGKSRKIFIYQIFSGRIKFWGLERRFVYLHITLLHQENKLPTWMIRKKYPEKNNCPNSSFYINFFTKTTKKTFSSDFKPTIWTTKRCYVLILKIKAKLAIFSHYSLLHLIDIFIMAYNFGGKNSV